METVKALLNAGADPLAKDRLHNEWNALHFAIMQDNVEIVKTLIERNKNLADVRDAVGRLPLVVAEDHFKAKVADYLKTIQD